MTDQNDHPPRAALELQRLAELRRRAAQRLPGAAAVQGPATGAAEALIVLHSMASSPGSAAQALALLHELQVHQVELDLQTQELTDARNELEAALRRQTERYDHLPMGCLTLDAQLNVQELNLLAAQALGVERECAVGEALGQWLSGDSLRQLRKAAASVDAGGPPAACVLVRSDGGRRPVAARLGADPAAHGYLLALAEPLEA